MVYLDQLSLESGPATCELDLASLDLSFLIYIKEVILYSMEGRMS